MENIIITIAITSTVFTILFATISYELLKKYKQQIAIYKVLISEIDPIFFPIKDVRPTPGKHIFIWDCVEKKALPTIYSGSEEIWEKTKDSEKRFTHFIELDLPLIDPIE